MGTLVERNYACALTVQPPTINHQYLPTSQDGGSLYKHKNFVELPQTLLGIHKAN